MSWETREEIEREVEKKPNPGSDAARQSGCKCPVIDNHHGYGIPMSEGEPPVFYINESCPLHGKGD